MARRVSAPFGVTILTLMVLILLPLSRDLMTPRYWRDARLWALAMLGVLLYGVQVVVGGAQVLTRLAGWTQTLHVAFGAITWAVFAGLAAIRTGHGLPGVAAAARSCSAARCSWSSAACRAACCSRWAKRCRSIL